MTRVLNRMSDRLLSRFVPKAEAGACVPEHGNSCEKWCGTCSCEPGERWIRKRCYGYISCTGSCTTTSTACFTTQNLC